jgi:hypothetical protein
MSGRERLQGGGQRPRSLADDLDPDADAVHAAGKLGDTHGYAAVVVEGARHQQHMRRLAT